MVKRSGRASGSGTNQRESALAEQRREQKQTDERAQMALRLQMRPS